MPGKEKETSRAAKPIIRRCVHTTWFTEHRLWVPFLWQDFPILFSIIAQLSWAKVERKHTLILKVFHRLARLVITRFESKCYLFKRKLNSRKFSQKCVKNASGGTKGCIRKMLVLKHSSTKTWKKKIYVTRWQRVSSQDLLKESELVFTEVWPQPANNAMGPPSLKPGW